VFEQTYFTYLLHGDMKTQVRSLGLFTAISSIAKPLGKILNSIANSAW